MQFRKILVPIDFSHFSKKALEAAIKLAKCCGSRIYLLHVEDNIFHMEQIHAVDPNLKEFCEKVHKDFVTGKKKSLEKFKSYIPKKFFAQAIIKEGHPFVEIVKFAKSKHMDLIVISSHGRSELRHAFLGSTSDKVSRKAECAVLIVKHKTCKFLPL